MPGKTGNLGPFTGTPTLSGLAFVHARTGRTMRTMNPRPVLRWALPCLCSLGFLSLAAVPGRAQPAGACDAGPQVVTLPGAVAWALRNNPELAAFRQQHG